MEVIKETERERGGEGKEDRHSYIPLYVRYMCVHI